MARVATGRAKLSFCDHAFHGLTMGSLSLNGDHSFRDGFGPLLADSVRVPFNDLPALEAALAGGDVAAFFVEPIQGKGVYVPSPTYLAEAARLCRAQGTLFVADEIQSGIGRTCKFLSIGHAENVEPGRGRGAGARAGGGGPGGAGAGGRG